LINKNKLPLSSSPEYHDNNIKAWFKDYTNYDLSLIKSFYDFGSFVTTTAYERRPNEWLGQRMMLQDLNFNETGLTVAPGQNLDESHRHFSPYMAIHPLGLLNVEDEKEKDIINKSLRWIEKKGTRNWCGYSFSWMGCIYARAQEGDSAASMLKKFATNFVSSNSFHLNGDQKGGQYSNFTYRPFTLEGNFAFAQGIHEMLLQSHKGFIEVFPALPLDWKDISFQTLRTEGAFLVSAKKEGSVITEVKIKSEAGGMLSFKLPFKTWIVTGVDRSLVKIDNGIAEVKTLKGQTISFSNAFE
jgi:alpha-L-fucosidase 2